MPGCQTRHALPPDTRSSRPWSDQWFRIHAAAASLIIIKAYLTVKTACSLCAKAFASRPSVNRSMCLTGSASLNRHGQGLTGLTRPSLHAQRRYRWPGQARPRRVRGQCRIQREGTHDEPGRADPAGHDQRGHAGFLDPSEIRQSRSGVLAASSTRAPGAACDDDVRGPWATPAKSWIAHSMLGLAVCLPQDVVQHARSGMPGDVTDQAFAQKRIRPV
jgi:hypothetical protein